MPPQFGHGLRLTWNHFPHNCSHLQAEDEALRGMRKKRCVDDSMCERKLVCTGWPEKKITALCSELFIENMNASSQEQ